MKNSILNLGKALNKAEQKQINGGYMAVGYCSDNCNCSSGQVCERKPCDGTMTLMCVS